MRKITCVIAATILLILFNFSLPTEAKSESTLRLDKEIIALWENEKGTIKAKVSNGSSGGNQIVWTSSDSFIADVSNGKVTPISMGTCIVTAKLAGNDDVTADCEVAVLGDLSGSVDSNYLKLYCDDYKQLTTKAKEAKYAVLAYRDVLDYCQLVNRTTDSQIIEYFVQQAEKNGEIYINGGTMSTNVAFGDKFGHTLDLNITYKAKTILYFVFNNKPSKVINSPKRVDIVQFRKYMEMDTKEILLDME